MKLGSSLRILQRVLKANPEITIDDWLLLRLSPKWIDVWVASMPVLSVICSPIFPKLHRNYTNSPSIHQAVNASYHSLGGNASYLQVQNNVQSWCFFQPHPFSGIKWLYPHVAGLVVTLNKARDTIPHWVHPQLVLTDHFNSSLKNYLQHAN